MIDQRIELELHIHDPREQQREPKRKRDPDCAAEGAKHDRFR